MNIEAPHLPKQARSRAKRTALIAKGVDLLEARDFDEFSVAEITQALGFSTGSFYSYFADKTAFFVEIQKSVGEAQDAILTRDFDPARITPLPLTERLDACTDFTIRYFRKHTGVVRAALRYERRIPEGWAPNRATTSKLIRAASVNLSPRDSQHLEMSIQLAFGLLVNALLHDPGPLRLNDKDLKVNIRTALEPFLTQ